MKLIAKGHWSSTTFGSFADGDIFEVKDEGMARNLIERGYALEYEIKPRPVSAKKPSKASESTSSQAEPVAQAPKKSKKSKAKAK